MVAIYIGSTTPRTGKSLVAMSLGLSLKGDGHSVGYMKPYGQMPRRVDDHMGDEDALLVQEVLDQNAPADLLTPVVAPANIRAALLGGDNGLDRTATAYAHIAKGRDVMLVGGSGSLFHTGRARGVDGLAVIERLNLKVLLVERFRNGGMDHDAILHAASVLGPRLAGVLLNDIPDSYQRDAEEVLVPFLQERGVRVLGLVPHEPLLHAIRASDLALKLGGRLVSGSGGASRLVEGFLIGTMQVENFMSHFRRHANTATIVGGDRTDLQLVALEGKCPCLVLTGNLPPDDIIRARSEAQGVPVIVVREDTYTVARAMEDILNSQKLRDLVTIRRGADIVAAALDRNALLAQPITPKEDRS